MEKRYRQEVLNVVLAQLLNDWGVSISPETIIRGEDSSRNMPDLLAKYKGLRVAFECEIDDQYRAAEKAKALARKRVEENISHIGIALIYPCSLRTKEFKDLNETMRNASLSFAIITEANETEFLVGGINRLADELNYSYEHLVNEDVVKKAVLIIESGIDKFSKALMEKSGNLHRVANVLGIKNPNSK